jgi:hypothetical protein
MKQFLFILFLIIYSELSSQIIEIKNSFVFGGVDSDSIVKITADNQNNIYSVGHFYGEIDLNHDSIEKNIYQSIGLSDFFIQKTNTNGEFVWGKRFGADSIDKISNIIYFDNKLFITGQFSKTIKLDNIELKSNGKLDAFIAALDTYGNVIWANSYGGVSNDVFSTCLINNSGIIISGLFTGNIMNQTTNGSLIISKLKLDGSQLIWSKSLGENFKINPKSSVFDSQGNIILTGSFVGEKIDFNPTTTKDSLLSSEKKPNTTFYTHDAFILKLNFNGDFMFVKKIGGSTGDDIILDVFSNKDKIAITGQISGSIVFGDGTTSKTIISNGKEDIFVALYTDLGEFVWVKNTGGLKTDFGKSVYLDSSSNVYVTGTFFDTDGKGVDFDPSTKVFKLNSSTSQNAFIWVLSSNGEYLFANSIGGSGVDNGLNVYQQNKNIFISGLFEGKININDKTYNSQGKSDIFIIKYTFLCNSINFNLNTGDSIVICSNETAKLTSNYPINSIFNWYRDGILISNNSILDNINIAGIYNLKVKYNFCEQTSNPVKVRVNEIPNAYIYSYGKIDFCQGDSLLLIAKGGNNYNWNNLFYNDSIYIKEGGKYTVKVTDNKNCSNTAYIDINNGTIPLSEEICLVTCVNNMNQIIWKNSDNLNKVKYRIYKQSKLNSSFEKVHEQLSTELSQWIDSNSSNQLERYKISVIDYCGNESQLSNNHTTIVLSSNLGVNGTVNLSWNPYEGFEYDNFEIWRSTDGKYFTKISSVANNTYIYIDNNLVTNTYYQIRINKKEECTPTKRGINFVGSNIISKDGKNLDLNSLNIHHLNFYPNPTNGIVTIENLNDLIGESIYFSDVTGRKIFQTTITKSTENIDLKDLNKGAYFVTSNQKFLTKLIIE